MALDHLSSFQLMKLQNKSHILEIIRAHGPISRADVAKKTRLTPPTVTNLVNELLQTGIVIESQIGTSTGGRKPILLTIHYEAFQIIGIHIGVSTIKLVVTDLKGELLDKVIISMPDRVDQTILLELVTDLIQERMQQDWKRPKHILGIGVGMHGLVDPERGISIFAPNLKLRQVPIRDHLAAKFNLPVYIENDAMATALGERWFGDGIGVDHFISVIIGMGVGAGIYLNGELYRGTNNSAGEIGHSVVDVEGKPCSCGNKGCLQTLVTGQAIAQKALDLYDQHLEMNSKHTPLANIIREHGNDLTGELVYEAALMGDPDAVSIFRNIGTQLGIGLANLINTLNPQKIILGGSVSRSSNFFMDTLKVNLYERVLETSKDVDIVVTRLGEFAAAIGAATIVLQVIFSKDNPILLD